MSDLGFAFPMSRLGREPDIPPGGIVVVACVRNEMLRLPWFLAHHRKLGVAHFLIIDNDSEDGTIEFLRQQPDVTLFETPMSYAESKCGVLWQNAVLDAYVQGRWALILDADEVLVYPRCESLPVRALTNYLEHTGADAFMAPLLDMYSDGPITATGYVSGAPFTDACPYFDCNTYEYASIGPGGSQTRIRGGPRRRLFWDAAEVDHPAPFLTKIPLIFWKSGRALEASTHILRDARMSEATGVLLHFKFLQDFAERAQIETARKEHFAGARQYAAYWQAMSGDPDLSAYHAGAAKYRDSLQLVELGLMRMPSGYPEG